MYTIILTNVYMGKIKINLNTIKTKNNIPENINNKIKKEKIPPIKNKSNEIERPIKVEEKDIKKKIGISSIKKKSNEIELPKDINESSIKKKINISSIKKKGKPANDIISKNKVETKKEKIKEEQAKEKKPLFDNYKSVFEKEKVPILEHIKKLKNLPRTNLLLLTMLISVTIAGIGFLFYSNPKIHNLDNYKTSIIDTYRAITYTGNTSSNNINKPPNIKHINKGGYIYNVEIKKVLGKDIYIYKGKYFDNKDRFNKFINKEIENRKRIKVTATLKNSFSK